VVTPEAAAVRLDLPGSAFLPDTYVADSGAKLEAYRRFAAIHSEADVGALRTELRDRFGPIPEPVEGLFRAVAVRMAAEAAGVPEVHAEAGRVTFKWPRFDRASVVATLMRGGFHPVAASNQVRLPVPAGREPVDVALRALDALGKGDAPA
jgi:transcription-repair coupling factor (superfamily II helicase)